MLIGQPGSRFRAVGASGWWFLIRLSGLRVGRWIIGRSVVSREGHRLGRLILTAMSLLVVVEAPSSLIAVVRPYRSARLALTNEISEVSRLWKNS